MSTNISKLKRQELLSKIEKIKEFIQINSDKDIKKDLQEAILEIEKELQSKKFGLIFEEHEETLDGILLENEIYVKEDPELEINNGGQSNFIIEGDNLAALKILRKTHKEKIDLIYIDPPYNTLKEGFTYSDSIVDKKDLFRHSKWLSFMEKRLKEATYLLSDSGVIFISVGVLPTKRGYYTLRNF